MRYLSVFPVILLLLATSARAQYTFDAGETGSHLLVSPPLPQFPPPPKVPPPGPQSNSPFVIQLVPLDGQAPGQTLIFFACATPGAPPAGITSWLSGPTQMVALSTSGHFNDLHNRYQLSLWVASDCTSNNYRPAQFVGTDVINGISTVFKFKGGDPTNPSAIIEIGITDGSSGGGLTAAGLIDCNGSRETIKRRIKN